MLKILPKANSLISLKKKNSKEKDKTIPNNIMDKQYKVGTSNNDKYFSLFNQMFPKLYNNIFNSKFGRRNRIFFMIWKICEEAKNTAII